MTTKLELAFYARDARVVAKALIGKWLRHGELAGRIVETEAYLGAKDAASHARFGPAGRAKVMYGPAGVAYVYLIYGMHECLNVVTGDEGAGQAVLLRAIEPSPPLARCDGPGRLTKAMGIDRRYNGHSLLQDDLYIEDRHEPAPRVRTTARIGVTYADAWANKRYRWVDARSEGLSVRLPGAPRR